MISVRARVALILTVVVVAFILLNFAVIRAVMIPAFQSFEQDEAKQSVVRCVEVLQQEFQELDGRCREVVTYRQVQRLTTDRDAAAAKLYLEDMFKMHSLDVIYLCDEEGNVLFGEVRQPLESGGSQKMDVPSLPTQHFPARHALLQHDAGAARKTGIIMVKEQVLLVASRPVPASGFGRRQTAGTVIVGRFFDGPVAARLQKKSGMKFTLRTASGLSIPAGDMGDIMETGVGKPLVLDAAGHEYLVAGVFMADMNSVPSVFLEAQIPFKLKEQGEFAFRVTVIAITEIGLVLLLVMFFVFRRTLTRPLTTLNEHVARVVARQQPDDKTVIVERQPAGPVDEISRLSRDFDRLVTRLSEQERSLGEREQRLARQNSRLVELARSQSLAGGESSRSISEIIEAAAGTLDVEQVAVWLFSDDRSHVYCMDCFRLASGRHSAAGRRRVVDFLDYFEAVEAERILAAEDVARDPRLRRLADAELTAAGVVSVLHVPMRRGGRTVGVLTHEHIGQNRYWNVEEQNFACSMADLACLALETSRAEHAERALERRSRIMEALAVAAERLLRPVPWLEHAEEILGLLGRSVGAGAAQLLRFEEQAGGRLGVRSLSRWQASAAGNEVLPAVNGEVLWGGPELERWRVLLKTNTAIAGQARDFPVRERDFLLRNGVDSMAAVPVFVEQRLWGVLQFHGGEPAATCSGAELETLKTAATIIGEAVVRAEAEERRAHLTAAMSQAAEAIIITDPNGVIQYMNPAFTRITGYSREEAVGRTPRILKSGVHPTEFYQDMWDRIRRGEVWTGRLTNRRKDGTLYHEECTISAVRDAGGDIVNFVSVKRDVGRQVELETQLRQAQKMEALGQLAGGVAHDFNNLMTVITMNTEYIRLSTEEDTPTSANLDEIIQAAGHASNLTRQLLAFARRQSLEPEVINPNLILLEMDKMIRRLLREDIELAVVPAPDLCDAQVDRSQIEQVIINLVVNARDAMKGKGSLVLRTRNVTLTPGHPALVTGGKAGPYACLSFTDTGPGISKELQNRIFEPFFTTKAAEEGTGLGLATVYGIVRQHQGVVSVDSGEGKGATFSIYLPRAESPAPPAVPQPPDLGLPHGTETVLLVEDLEALRNVSAQLLRRLGYAVLEAENGAQALDVANRHPDDIHLLFTDVVMPLMGGQELAENLQRQRPGIKVIFTSGYTRTFKLKDDIVAGGGILIQKPYDPVTLGHKIREVLDGNATGPVVTGA
ncbi:MAG: hypothetical protein A3K19_26960 [Lentisphaerae bacterium RIFOXYB12_FULL_65_16]|nr:MAG: hypothetical protein A3K18_23935 [Lentisphaerae bacterium RIFOXYA12_64_32]OGV88038.1 MAG: hypothetical protein A3K19_26960 [Lentisphaerae bacterium RIFOXYB12_FULL_65_16]